MNKKNLDDEYRNRKHIPIYITGGNDANNYDDKTDYSWTEQLKQQCQKLLNISKLISQPGKPLGRIMIICTRAGEEKSHIDCSPDKFDNTLQHKWRLVLDGTVDSLYYMNNEEEVPTIVLRKGPL